MSAPCHSQQNNDAVHVIPGHGYKPRGEVGLKDHVAVSVFLGGRGRKGDDKTTGFGIVRSTRVNHMDRTQCKKTFSGFVRRRCLPGDHVSP